MARAMRVEYPGALYLITSPSNERRPIFRDDRVLPPLPRAPRRGHPPLPIVIASDEICVYHLHLVIETPKPALFLGMQWLNAGHARLSRLDRVGPACFS